MAEEMDLSAVIKKLMESDEASEMIAKLKASVENSPSSEDKKAEIGEILPVSEERTAENVSGSEKQSSAELFDKLPQVMAALAPLMENGTLGKKNQNRTSEQRNNLLTALKPYLNEGRRGMIDNIMTISKFSGLMDLIPRDK